MGKVIQNETIIITKLKLNKYNYYIKYIHIALH